MIHIETVDLSSRDIVLPSDRVGMVIAQPYVPRASLSAVEPFSYTEAAKPLQLAILNETLAVARALRHREAKTHFTVFPEYSIPGLDGIASLDTKAKELETRLLRMRDALREATEGVQSGTADLTVREQTFNRLQGEIQRFRQDPRLTQVSLDIDLTELADLEKTSQRNISDLNDALAKAEVDNTTHRNQLLSLRQESNALKTQLAHLRTQLTVLQQKLTEIMARLTELKLPRDAAEKMLLALIDKESQDQIHLLTLRDSAHDMELAIDAATTAAALTRLRGNIRNKERYQFQILRSSTS